MNDAGDEVDNDEVMMGKLGYDWLFLRRQWHPIPVGMQVNGFKLFPFDLRLECDIRKN